MSKFVKQVKYIQTGNYKLSYAVVPWDSTYLHNTTIELNPPAKITLLQLSNLFSKLIRKTHLKKRDLIVCKIPFHEFSMIYQLHKVGFYFIEQTVTISIDLTNWNPKIFSIHNINTHKLLPASVSDLNTIKDIAHMTFTTDRFHMDSNIPKKLADHRFSQWIENSFQSDDIVFKFMNDKKFIVGFFIVRKNANITELRLAGLHPKYVGQGIGKLLYFQMYKLLKEKNHKNLHAVVSFNNIAVLNVYAYLGKAKFNEPLVVLHNIL